MKKDKIVYPLHGNKYSLERIIRRDDGSRVRILVNIMAAGGAFWYEDWCFFCKPKKRKFEVIFVDEVEKFVSAPEIYATKLMLWEKLKPEEGKWQSK